MRRGSGTLQPGLQALLPGSCAGLRRAQIRSQKGCKLRLPDTVRRTGACWHRQWALLGGMSKIIKAAPAAGAHLGSRLLLPRPRRAASTASFPAAGPAGAGACRGSSSASGRCQRGGCAWHVAVHCAAQSVLGASERHLEATWDRHQTGPVNLSLLLAIARSRGGRRGDLGRQDGLERGRSNGREVLLGGREGAEWHHPALRTS